MRIAIAIMCGFISIVSSLGIADYSIQAINSTQGFVEFGLSGWVESVAERGQIAAEKRRTKQHLEENLAKDLRDLLPAAPHGWRKQSWSMTQSQIMRGRFQGPIPSHDEMEKRAIEELSPKFSALSDEFNSFSGKKYVRREAKQTWVYVQGSERIAVRIRQIDKPRKARTVSEVAIQNMQAHENWDKDDIAFARIKGVVFVETVSDFEHLAFRTIEADMIVPDGSSIRITVKAQAKDRSIKKILNGIHLGRIRQFVSPSGTAPAMAAGSDDVRKRREAALERERQLLRSAAQDRADHRSNVEANAERYSR
ncbi:MAG: hypothetical protein ACRBB0_09545 [Pelagimonas sp.]|uniref:hypothetical protein n=1 Tax=Pelagimonas sp. TaxID=2073170 RepID=UPI003D6A0127